MGVDMTAGNIEALERIRKDKVELERRIAEIISLEFEEFKKQTGLVVTGLVTDMAVSYSSIGDIHEEVCNSVLCGVEVTVDMRQ